jgi:hypothetical protein
MTLAYIAIKMAVPTKFVTSSVSTVPVHAWSVAGKGCCSGRNEVRTGRLIIASLSSGRATIINVTKHYEGSKRCECDLMVTFVSGRAEGHAFLMAPGSFHGMGVRVLHHVGRTADA